MMHISSGHQHVIKYPCSRLLQPLLHQQLLSRTINMTLNITIVGAGISGLCTAIALRRAGHKVQVRLLDTYEIPFISTDNRQIFEKSHFATEIGAAVSLAPNGVVVLQSLGFNFIRAQACRHKTWEVLNGQTFERLALQKLDDIAHITGVDYWTVHRVDLHKELLRLALDANIGDHDTAPVKIHYGALVRDVDALNGLIYLADGSVHEADLVIAADGIHSTVRGCVVPSHLNNRAIETGMSAFRFLLPSEMLQARPDIMAVMRKKTGDTALLADTMNVVRDSYMVWYGCRGYVTLICRSIGYN